MSTPVSVCPRSWPCIPPTPTGSQTFGPARVGRRYSCLPGPPHHTHLRSSPTSSPAHSVKQHPTPPFSVLLTAAQDTSPQGATLQKFCAYALIRGSHSPALVVPWTRHCPMGPVSRNGGWCRMCATCTGTLRPAQAGKNMDSTCKADTVACGASAIWGGMQAAQVLVLVPGQSRRGGSPLPCRKQTYTEHHMKNSMLIRPLGIRAGHTKYV